jgi:hypothetical protein
MPPEISTVVDANKNAPHKGTLKVMEELISRIIASVGIDQELASKAVGIILNMFRNNGDADLVGQLMAALPGADALADAADGDTSGGAIGSMLGNMLGGNNPIMEMAGQLTSAGLSIDQTKGVGKEVLAFGEEKLGADTMAQLIKSIPGLEDML